MRFSMKTEYGVRAAVELAANSGRGALQSGEIARRQGIPGPFLDQVLMTLRRAGLVTSTRGPHGGHELARRPDQIRLDQVIACLEGDGLRSRQEGGAGAGDSQVLAQVTEKAERTARSLNPDVMVQTIEATVDERNAMAILGRYDVIVDGTDSFRARYLLSDAAYLLKKPLVHGSIFRIEGQVTVFQPGRGCYRCLYPEPPPAGAIGESEQVGVLAALPGIIGTIQAAETIKLITQVGDGLVNRVLLHDAMAMTFQEVRYRRNRGCPLCGDRPTIRSLVDYGAFTGAEALR